MTRDAKSEFGLDSFLFRNQASSALHNYYEKQNVSPENKPQTQSQATPKKQGQSQSNGKPVAPWVALWAGSMVWLYRF